MKKSAQIYFKKSSFLLSVIVISLTFCSLVLQTPSGCGESSNFLLLVGIFFWSKALHLSVSSCPFGRKEGLFSVGDSEGPHILICKLAPK